MTDTGQMLMGVKLPTEIRVTNLEVDRPYEGYVGLSGDLCYKNDVKGFTLSRAIDDDFRGGGGSFVWFSCLAAHLDEEIERWWKLPAGMAKPITEMGLRVLDAATVLVLSDENETLESLQRDLNAALEGGQGS